MKRFSRLLVAIAIVISGVALMPFIALPATPFGWQRYAAVYQPGAVVDIDIVDFAFKPQVAFVPLGATVRWTNRGNERHTATSTKFTPSVGGATGQNFDSGELRSGESFTTPQVFVTPGVYEYVCTRHSNMVGKLIVGSYAQSHVPLLQR